MFATVRRSLARVGRWPRLAAAGVCLLLAAASALGSGTSRPARTAPGVAVVVAARDLPAGYRLVRADLVIARWPTALRPAGARGDPAGLIGTTLAVPLGRREAVTSARVIGPGLTSGLPEGTVATVVAVDQDVGSLVRPGDRVDLLAAPRDDLGTGDTEDSAAAPRRSVEVGHRVLVLAAVASAGVDGTPATSLVLGVDRATALRIAELRTLWTFSPVVTSP